jgi:hypothetical protein
MGTHAFEACAFDRSATSPTQNDDGYHVGNGVASGAGTMHFSTRRGPNVFGSARPSTRSWFPLGVAIAIESVRISYSFRKQGDEAGTTRPRRVLDIGSSESSRSSTADERRVSPHRGHLAERGEAARVAPAAISRQLPFRFSSNIGRQCDSFKLRLLPTPPDGLSWGVTNSSTTITPQVSWPAIL